MPVIQPLAGASQEAPKTYKQPSRKGKKAWRKNVDVTEVVEGLAELNDEIIKGGVIKEKASDDLFLIDKKGDSEIAKRNPKYAKKGLRADEILAQRSAVPAVSMRKRAADKSEGVVPTKRHKGGWVPQKELARLKRVADGQHEMALSIPPATYDVWDAPAPEKQQDVDDFIPDEVRAKTPKSMHKDPLTLLASGKKIRAVPKPSGGYSYNPSFDEYEQRLTTEGQKALEAEQKRLEEEEEEQRKQEAIARSAAEAEAAEARANLSEWEEDSEWEGFQSGAEDKPSTKRPERKTQAQRNRIKRRKEDEQLAKHKAALKARRAQEQRIKELAEEVETREQAKALALALAAEEAAAEDSESELGAEQKLRRKQLGKYKLPENDLELVLPDELQESLRLLKPEGNLLKDRYRSALLRGKVEARRHIPFHKQAKRKATEKWTYKDFVI